jgi:hypothetical protein
MTGREGLRGNADPGSLQHTHHNGLDAGWTKKGITLHPDSKGLPY